MTLKVLPNFHSHVSVSMEARFQVCRDSVEKQCHFFMSVEMVLEYPDGLQLPKVISMIDERIKEVKVRDEVMGDI